MKISTIFNLRHKYAFNNCWKRIFQQSKCWLAILRLRFTSRFPLVINNSLKARTLSAHNLLRLTVRTRQGRRESISFCALAANNIARNISTCLMPHYIETTQSFVRIHRKEHVFVEAERRKSVWTWFGCLCYRDGNFLMIIHFQYFTKRTLHSMNKSMSQSTKQKWNQFSRNKQKIRYMLCAVDTLIVNHSNLPNDWSFVKTKNSYRTHSDGRKKT